MIETEFKTSTKFIKEIKVVSHNPLYVKNSLTIGVNENGQPMLGFITPDKDDFYTFFKAYIITSKQELYAFLEGKQNLYQTILKSHIILRNSPRRKIYSAFNFTQNNGPDICLNFGKELENIINDLEPLIK